MIGVSFLTAFAKKGRATSDKENPVRKCVQFTRLPPNYDRKNQLKDYGLISIASRPRRANRKITCSDTNLADYFLNVKKFLYYFIESRTIII